MNNDNILESKRAWRDREAQAIRSIRRAFDDRPLINPSQGESAINFLISVGVAAVIFAAACIAGCHEAHAEEIDMKKIAMIESSGCKFKVGDDGKSLGCHQVSGAVLKEYNDFNKARYTKADLMNDAISLKISSWYANQRIPALLKHFGKEDTVTNRLIAYNAGIKAVIDGRVPKVTKAYLKKYGV